ncbi:MAG: Asp-tRNA(Asn)/Glu-tRNA(Gln) amidotransferase subunit GatA [Deltaproteobacteria bacterium]|nr:Asp-tRNA(Asn)/Glu-tRNA(Gln) amidotransferase subunit GatA [Deltaproteobacteria bacterium]
MTDVTSLSIAEINSGLVSKSFSSRELTQAYLERIEKLKSLNCYIEVCGESALKAADECDQMIKSGRRLPLLGVPIAIKDVITTKGIRTTCASKMLKDFIPPYDATAIIKMRENGGFVLGKTNMDEFAMGSSTENSFFGASRNPWDTARVPGGSSGGSAVAVAAALAPASLGSDTGGSVRQPASYCNVVGLKPTYGRISRYGLIAYASSLDQIGIFSRTVADCALLAQSLFGHDPLDSTSVEMAIPDLSKEIKRGIKGLKIGIPKEYLIEGVSKEVLQSVQDALSTLTQLGAEIVDISLPHTEYALACYYILALAEASSNLARYDGIRYGYRSPQARDLKQLYSLSRSEGFGKEVKRRIMVGTYALSAGYYDAYYKRAQQARTLIAQDFRSAFSEQCDVIACPTAPTTAFRIGEQSSDPVQMYLNDIFTVPVNLAGLPGISIPCGFDSQGLPVGLQLIGKPWDEGTLLRAANAYESSTDWHKRFPEV